MNAVQLFQQEGESRTHARFNFKTGKKETMKCHRMSENFVPFLRERDQIGKLSCVMRLSDHQTPATYSISMAPRKRQMKQLHLKRLKLAFDEETQISPPVSTTKKHKKFTFLKQLSQGGIQGIPTSRWEKVSLKPPQWNRRFSDLHDLQKNVEDHIGDRAEDWKSNQCFIEKFVKHDKYIEKYSHVSTSPVQTPATGERDIKFFPKQVPHELRLAPPVGYYNVQSNKGSPMLVNMAKSSTSKHWRTQSFKVMPHLTSANENLKYEEHPRSQLQEQLHQLADLQKISEGNVKKKLEVEYYLLKERQKFCPQQQSFDLEYLNNFPKRIDTYKKKIRQMKGELATWADKQVQVFKQNQ